MSLALCLLHFFLLLPWLRSIAQVIVIGHNPAHGTSRKMGGQLLFLDTILIWEWYLLTRSSPRDGRLSIDSNGRGLVSMLSHTSPVEVKTVGLSPGGGRLCCVLFTRALFCVPVREGGVASL